MVLDVKTNSNSNTKFLRELTLGDFFLPVGDPDKIFQYIGNQMKGNECLPMIWMVKNNNPEQSARRDYVPYPGHHDSKVIPAKRATIELEF